MWNVFARKRVVRCRLTRISLCQLVGKLAAAHRSRGDRPRTSCTILCIVQRHNLSESRKDGRRLLHELGVRPSIRPSASGAISPWASHLAVRRKP